MGCSADPPVDPPAAPDEAVAAFTAGGVVLLTFADRLLWEHELVVVPGVTAQALRAAFACAAFRSALRELLATAAVESLSGEAGAAAPELLSGASFVRDRHVWSPGIWDDFPPGLGTMPSAALVYLLLAATAAAPSQAGAATADAEQAIGAGVTPAGRFAARLCRALGATASAPPPPDTRPADPALAALNLALEALLDARSPALGARALAACAAEAVWSPLGVLLVDRLVRALGSAAARAAHTPQVAVAHKVLWSVSPLSRLCLREVAGLPPLMAESAARRAAGLRAVLAPCVAGAMPQLMRALQGTLATAWIEAERWRLRRGGAERAAWLAERVAVQGAFLELAAKAGDDDLLLSLARFARRFVVEWPAERFIQRVAGGVAGRRTLRDKQALATGELAAFEVVDAVAAHVRQVRAQPVAERSAAETRLVESPLVDFARLWPEVRLCRRRLAVPRREMSAPA